MHSLTRVLVGFVLIGPPSVVGGCWRADRPMAAPFGGGTAKASEAVAEPARVATPVSMSLASLEEACGIDEEAVFFDPQSSNLSPAGRLGLAMVAGCLDKPRWKEGSIAVYGFAQDGREASSLGRERVEAVQAFLVTYGVDRERFVTPDAVALRQPVADERRATLLISGHR